jgi:hypothetical protein
MAHIYGEALQVWLYLAMRGGIPPPLALKTWEKLEAHPHSLPLRKSFSRAFSAGPPGSPARRRAATRMGSGPGSPRALIFLLEEVYDSGALTRQEVTAVEECLFRLVTRDGEWR